MALAIFDLDNTLIAGDSDHGWGEFLVAQGKVNADEYQAKNDAFYQDYQNGSLNMRAYLEFSLQPLVALNNSELKKLHQAFMLEVIEPMCLPKAAQLLQKHRTQGDILVVITSTNRFVVEPICNSLGVDQVLATEPEIIDGKFTGNIVGEPCFQAGKITHLNRWLGQSGESMNGATFYSDSINDLPLLEIVDKPVAVDPCDALRAEATRRGWKIISLRS